jgi:catechol 2,3-dioxygenase-like lactoylglutathione lyase family enzyme
MKIQSKFTLLIILVIACTGSSQAQSEFSSTTIGIGVVVSDLDKSLDFYTNVIGLKKVGGFDVDEDFAAKSGLTGGPPFKVTTLKLEDELLGDTPIPLGSSGERHFVLVSDPDGILIELIGPLKDK